MSICSEKIKLDYEFDIVVKKTTESTNKEAKELFLKNRKNVLVIAEEQTAGRGRFDRKFSSPEGKGIYMSLAFSVSDFFKEFSYITPFAAVAVSQAIRKIYHVEPKIKWVNDVYINNKKVCGILSEIVFCQSQPDFVIVGIGVNVHKYTFEDELKQIATSIENECEFVSSRNKLVSEIVNVFLSMKDNETILGEYRKNSLIIGKNVTVYSGNDVFEAYVEDIDKNANLVVRTDFGKRTINAGEVSIKL